MSAITSLLVCVLGTGWKIRYPLGIPTGKPTTPKSLSPDLTALSWDSTQPSPCLDSWLRTDSLLEQIHSVTKPFRG